MRIFSALVRREIFERRLLLLVSAFLGLVPIVLPLLPGSTERFSPEDLRVAVLMVMVVLFGGATLLIIGATIVGRDLSEGRLGFYFSHPVSAWALWGSRLVAAWVLFLASLLLMIGPSAAFDLGQWIEDSSDHPMFGVPGAPSGRAWPMLVFDQVFLHPDFDADSVPAVSAVSKLACVLGTSLLLLVLTHAVSTIVRGRSLWALADLGGLSAVVALAWAARDELVREQALGALVWAEWMLLTWILGALLLAGGVQLARGRTDLQRGHRFLSATLWPVLILGALAFNAGARWVTGSTIDDLEQLSFTRASPNEDWLLVGGRLRHRAGAAAAFLLKVPPSSPKGDKLNMRSQTSWRLGDLNVVSTWLEFSADGGTVVWASCERFRPMDCELWAKDLRDVESPPRRTGVPITSAWVPIALAADGSRLAKVEKGHLVVYDLSTASVLAAVEANDLRALYFASRDLVRFHQPIVEEVYWRNRIRQLDLRTRRSVETGDLPKGIVIRHSQEGDLVFKLSLFEGHDSEGEIRFGLYRGDTGEPLFELDGIWLSPDPDRVAFLADGRIVLGLPGQHDLTLLVLSPDGEEEHRVERPKATGIRFCGELEPGRVVLTFTEYITPEVAAASEPGLRTYVLDAGTGELTLLLDDAVPLGAPARTLDRRLLQTAGGEVVEWHPRTGERRTLLASSPRGGGGAPRGGQSR